MKIPTEKSSENVQYLLENNPQEGRRHNKSKAFLGLEDILKEYTESLSLQQYEVKELTSQPLDLETEPTRLNELIEMIMARILFLEDEKSGETLAYRSCLQLLEAGKTRKTLKLLVELGVNRSVISCKATLKLAGALLAALASGDPEKMSPSKDLADRLVHFLFYEYFAEISNETLWEMPVEAGLFH